MKYLFAVILYCILFDQLPDLLFNGDYSWYMGYYLKDCQIALFAAYVFETLKNTDILKRSIVLVFVIFKIMEAQWFFIYALLDYNVYSKTYDILFISSLITLAYNRFKIYDYKTHKINKDNINFCFWKPKRLDALIVSLFADPFGSMSIYCKGCLYGFRWRKDTYCKDEISKAVVESKALIYDTGIKADYIILKELKLLIGKKKNFLNSNCIKVLNPVLKKLGPTYSTGFLGNFPPFFAKMVLR